MASLLINITVYQLFCDILITYHNITVYQYSLNEVSKKLKMDLVNDAK